ncbi:heavy metal-binding protein HIP-like [Xiphias gladius]|uniref:heavy metal-binding protein HIP-like n=1 Tax=Xiphias gladius TaxID=8245 RepID=UPI001A99A0E2|nr:heavy metal-binding protein HIP-like [Xiphias gladius]
MRTEVDLSREAELSAVTLRLNVTEEQVDELRKHNTVGAAQLVSVSDRVTTAQRETEVLQVRLRAGEATVNELKAKSEAQSALLTQINSRLETAESQNAGFQIRLTAGDSLISELQTNTTVLERRLSDSDSLMMELHTEHSELKVRLRVGEKQLEDLKAQNTVLSFRVNVTDDRLQQIINTTSDEPKVAFSAGLTDSGAVGPFDKETTLTFSKTISNIGRAYNQTTGVFTAPVRGVYFFSFTAADYLKGYMGLYLYRNNQPLIFNLALNDHGGYASTSNSVALRLEEGDRVRLSLPASYRLYDDSRNFSVFSGFLLFPL